MPKNFCPTRVQSAQQITFAQQLDNNVLLLGKNNRHVGQILPITALMLGKYNLHVGQILPICWANTTHMLGKYCPHVGQIPPSVGQYGVSCCVHIHITAASRAVWYIARACAGDILYVPEGFSPRRTYFRIARRAHRARVLYDFSARETRLIWNISTRGALSKTHLIIRNIIIEQSRLSS